MGLFPSLVLIHFLGDFSLQSDAMAHAKKDLFIQNESDYSEKGLSPRKAMIEHILIHVVLVIITCVLCVYFHVLTFASMMWTVTLYSLLHLSIDFLKAYLRELTDKYQLAGFIIDQALHLLVIVMITFLYSGAEWNSIAASTVALLQGEKVYLTPLERITVMVILIICATSVSGIIVQMATRPSPDNTNDLTEDKTVKTYKSDTSSDVNLVGTKREVTSFNFKPSTISRGKRIGYIERLIVMILIFKGAYAAIGFIVTAKSLVRFKRLDDREWAEYFLIGTLLSMLLGSACGYALYAFMG